MAPPSTRTKDETELEFESEILTNKNDTVFSKSSMLITGFGPFGTHLVNPSNIAVSQLVEKWTPPDGIRVRIVPKLEVAYEPVRKTLYHIWQQDRPLLALHVGVGLPGEIHLEQQARNHGYVKPDVNGNPVCPILNDHWAFPPKMNPNEVYVSTLDQDGLLRYLRKQGWKVELSKDAGLFLCEFSMCNSLYWSTQVWPEAKQGRVLFLHLPPVGQPYSQDELNLIVLQVTNYLCEFQMK
jgi:pyroglutamyl-peptidase